MPREGIMEKITDKQEVASINVDGNDYEIPKDLALSTLEFFVMNSSGVISREADKLSTQAQIDSLFNSEEITEQTLVSALIGAQNRSNQLYNAGIHTKSLSFQELYLKYAAKYQSRVAQLAIAIAKLKNKEQKIIVEKVNIENGARAIVGNVSKQLAQHVQRENKIRKMRESFNGKRTLPTSRRINSKKAS